MSLNPAFLYPANNPQNPIAISEFHLLSSELCERQARIEAKENHHVIKDLRSGHPTRVNGTQIQEAILTEGDHIEISNEAFIFSYDSAAFPQGLGLKSKNEAWNLELQLLGNVAKTDYPVLILGPSGTGKDILAQSLHKASLRDQGPFVSVNCSALTETLIESELFGHIKGSFTGAVSDRKGAFEAARGGTLFLDEIGDLPYSLQAKLLRALENNEIRPVGSDKTVKTNVRIVAATHQNLLEKIHSKEFRSDLYFRLNVVSTSTPALFDRMEDFEELLYQFAKSMKVRFSFAAIQLLKRHSWPGNIRELKNTVARASALFPKQQIEALHVNKIIDRLTSPHQSLPQDQSNSVAHLPVIKEIEKQMIIKRLIANKGNQRRTATDLGMPKSTLHDRLRLYHINVKSFVQG